MIFQSPPAGLPGYERSDMAKIAQIARGRIAYRKKVPDR